jgi:hypothetical protein
MTFMWREAALKPSFGLWGAVPPLDRVSPQPSRIFCSPLGLSLSFHIPFTSAPPFGRLSW